MSNTNNQTTLKEVLDDIKESAEDRDTISIDDILDKVGRRSFGPILLVAGIVTLAPLIGDIPGVPSIMGAIVFLVAIQIFLSRKKLWLPKTILKRSVEKKKLQKAIDKLNKPAEFIDKILRPRLQFLTKGKMIYPIAMVCLGISIALPVMEFIPFSANFAGAALTAFGLALITKDGLVALFGYTFTASIVGFIIFSVT